MSKTNIKKRKKVKVENELLEKAIEDYTSNNLTLTACASKYSVGRTTLRRHLIDRGIPLNIEKKRMNYDTNYFEMIDTEEKAYWFGFISADGCITKNDTVLEIGLQISDECHIVKFLKSIGCETYKLSYRTVSSKIAPNKSKMARISISSIKICSDLIKHGITARKSTSLVFPKNIHPELMRHYIRGYFDGDGSISISQTIYNRDYYQVNIIATFEWLTEFMNILNYMGITKIKLTDRKNKMFVWNKKGRKQLKIFLDYMYKDATVYLDRKLKRYMDFCHS